MRSPVVHRAAGFDLAPGRVRHVDALFGGRRLRFAFPGTGAVPPGLDGAIGEPWQALGRLTGEGWRFEHVFHPILAAYPDLPAEQLTDKRSKVPRVEAVLRAPACDLARHAALAAAILRAGLVGLDAAGADFDAAFSTDPT